MEMTRDAISKIQKDKGFYRSPPLNEVLYLHYKGFERMAGLEEFVNARCLWLEGNCFTEIEGIDHLTEVRQLYLQENLIREIGTGLSNLHTLVQLNLSNNMITKIEGLAGLTSLKSLQMKQNRLTSYESIEHLLQVPSLQTLDLTENRLDDEAVVDIFAAMPNLLTLYAHKNPFTGKVRPYRKTVLGRCEKLKYLDDRPVFADERREITAWVAGGVEAEQAERKAIRDEKEAERLRNLQEFMAMREQWTQQRLDREARGEKLEPTEYYKNNHMQPTEEDKWFTEQRRRNSTMTEAEREKQRRELLSSLPGQRPAGYSSAPAAVAASPPRARHADPCSVQLPDSPATSPRRD
eukprot:TRINITY_DN4340_c0_g1_i2.p2 TRINITY_DN4340_c0_g1~~TRINITY_DN4340_c0_g1_i2.p2  ORF type:complete len:376 (+),score=146.99 TRINITY_DN4340_c0_g1_i2:77-1129(+)